MVVTWDMTYPIPDHNSTSVSLAEALSLQEALSWLKHLKMRKIQVVVDALLIVQALSSSTLDNSVLGLIISDCKFLSNEINQCNFSGILDSLLLFASRVFF